MELKGGMHEPVGYCHVFCRTLISWGIPVMQQFRFHQAGLFTVPKNPGCMPGRGPGYHERVKPAAIHLRHHPAPGSMSHHESSGYHEHHDSSPCRVCSSPVDPDHKATMSGICHHCVYKILILVLIVMIAISYVAWFGVL